MKVFNREIKLGGLVKSGIRTLIRDNDGKILLATGTTVPTGSGYSKGALFIDTDVATGLKGVYENIGTTSSASFIKPSHRVVASGQHTTAGGDTAESATVTGALATDIAIASIEDNGTNNVTLIQTAAASNAVNFTLSGDPSTDAIINYLVLRAC
jgi:hypothetical protein